MRNNEASQYSRSVARDSGALLGFDFEAIEMIHENKKVIYEEINITGFRSRDWNQTYDLRLEVAIFYSCENTPVDS